jgi:hypothetical protein
MKALTLAVAMLATSCAPQGISNMPPHGAAAVVAEMKAACGGDAWDRVQGWHETGVVDLPGRPGVPYEIWHDMRTLKTAMLNRVNGKVMRHAGFDGSTYWQVGPDGRAEVGRDPATLRRHRRDAYLSSSGWYFPERFPAAIALAGAETLDGKPLDILRITPEAADSFDLWVERDTHRIRKIVAGKEYANLTDYRMFGRVCSATNGRQGDGDPTHEVVLHVQTVDTSAAIPAATFEPPR